MHDVLPEHFEIVHLLGEGTFGRVYRARKGTVEYAVKVLNHGLKTPDLPENLRREFSITCGFNHRNLVRSHDLATFQLNGAHYPYIVMDLVEGTPLDQLGPFDPQTALDIVVDIAEGLADAAQKGVVHRDVKPRNVILTREGRAVVVDFGMARLVDPQWAEGTINTPGAANYCSPHTYYHAAAADMSDDIWSLGCVFYWLLTKRHAFWVDPNTGSLGALRDQIEHHDYEALPEAIPEDYRQLVDRMIEGGTKSGHQHYRTWDDFFDDVVQFPLPRRQPYALFSNGLTELRLSEFQTLVHRIYALANGVRKPEEIMLRLLSSAGQLGALISKGLETQRDAIQSELASFFCWLLALADATGIDLETAAWTKYPCVCPYCAHLHTTQADIDACKPERRVFRPAALMLIATQKEQERPQTLLEWEKHLQKIFPLTFVRDEPRLVQKLLEEAGEVGACLTRPNDRLNTLRRDYADPLAFELADVFAWISVCSRLIAADDRVSPLAVEMNKQYRLERCRRCNRAPCMCDPEQTTRARLVEPRRSGLAAAR